MSIITEQGWRGVNLSTAPETLAPGFLQKAENCIIVGGALGYLQTRPGFWGQFTTALGSPVTAYTTFPDNTGANWIVFCVGTGTSDGAIYRWKPGMTAPTLIPGLGTIDAPNVQFAVLGNYLFVVDGTSALKRIKNDWTAGIANGLNVPVYQLSASLLNTSLAAFTFAGSGFDGVNSTAVPGATSLTNGNALKAGTWTGWTNTGSNIEFQAKNVNGTTIYYVRMDDQSGSFTSVAIAWVSKQNTKTHGIGSTTRRPLHFFLQFDYIGDFDTDSVLATIEVYSDNAGANYLTEITREYTAPASTYKTFKDIISFAGILADTAIGSFKIRFNAGPANKPGVNGPYVTGVYVNAMSSSYFAGYDNGIALTTSGAGIGVRAQASVGDPLTAHVGGQHITIDLGAATNWSTYQNIAIAYSAPAELSVPIRARLGFRDSTGWVFTYSEYLEEYTGDAGGTYLTTDLSSGNVAASGISTFRYLDIIIDSDLSLASPNSGQVLVTFGAITLAGNLTVGTEYQWRVTETANSIESGAGTPSNAITATATQAQGQVLLVGSVPTNVGSQIKLWRRGGFSDGLWRLVATVTAGTASSGANWQYLLPSGPILYQRFIDNVPNSALELAETLQDHETPPSAPLAVAAYADRLALVANNSAGMVSVYLSQLETGPATGLYYNAEIVPKGKASPTADTDGAYYPLPAAKGAGRITKLVGYLNRLFLAFPSLWMTLSGQDLTEFSLRPWQGSDGRKGALAKNATIVEDGAILFLAADGIRVTDVATYSKITSDAINPAIAPGMDSFGASAISAADLAKASAWTHGGRVYLSLAGTIYVYDSRREGWTTWVTPTEIRGAVSLDGNDLYALGANGQILSVAPNQWGDKATAGGTTSVVTITIRSRGFKADTGQIQCLTTGFAGEGGSSGTPVAATVRVEVEGGNNVHGLVSGTNIWSQGYSLTGPTDERRLRTTRPAGWWLSWHLQAASATAPVSLRSFFLDLVSARGRI